MAQKVLTTMDPEKLSSRPGRHIGSERLDGYPTLANFIAQDQDAAIYRRFGRLSARNILYKQSELLELEEQLDICDKKDVRGDAETRKAARSWHNFWYNSGTRHDERRALVAKIRSSIKEYQEMLLLQAEIHKLEQPTPRTVASLREWFHANDVPVLSGRDKLLLDASHLDDLVALAPVETDRLNLFLQNNFGYFLKTKREVLPHKDMFYFPQNRVRLVGAIISTILSAVLLIGAIICLLLISSSDWRLRVGMIVLFTVLFALVVGLLTNARRAELFGCTAAYAAVLVVFVSGNFSSG